MKVIKSNWLRQTFSKAKRHLKFYLEKRYFNLDQRLI